MDNWLEIEGTTHNVATNGDGSCLTCHKSPRQEVIDAIASGPRPTRCLPCHSDKTASHSTVGSHPADAFSWDSNCSDCHGAGGEAELVVSEIHGDTCTLCHSDTPASRDNEMVGAAANGIDGDATQADGIALLAEGDIGQWNTPTCTTCHNPATYTWEAIHTDTATAVDHSATVTNVDTTCNGCHDAVSRRQAPDAINHSVCRCGEVHNNSTGAYSGTCANCHSTDGSLQAAPTRAPLLSATGGNCSACHDVQV